MPRSREKQDDCVMPWIIDTYTEEPLYTWPLWARILQVHGFELTTKNFNIHRLYSAYCMRKPADTGFLCSLALYSNTYYTVFKIFLFFLSPKSALWEALQYMLLLFFFFLLDYWLIVKVRNFSNWITFFHHQKEHTNWNLSCGFQVYKKTLFCCLKSCHGCPGIKNKCWS